MENKKLIEEILRAVASIKYGYVQIVIQNSKVVQIDKTDKVRFENTIKGVKPE